MELIRISDRKLKIMLTPVDMCHYELNPDSFGEDSAQMHRAFRLLLTEIRRQTDFDADDLHLSVQYFPSREGGCEMFICNLRDGEHATPAKSIPPLMRTETAVRPYKKHADCYRKVCAYRISRLCDLLSVCRRLQNVKCIDESSVWRDVGEDYFLFLTVRAASPYIIPSELVFVTEYGSLENEAHLQIYIREHATPVCEKNAVEQLSVLA